MPRIQDYKHLDSMKASCYLFNGKQRGVLSLNGHVQVFQMRHIQIFLSFFGTTTIELTHAVSLVIRSSTFCCTKSCSLQMVSQCHKNFLWGSKRMWYSPWSRPTPSVNTLGYFLTSCSFVTRLSPSPTVYTFTSSNDRCLDMELSSYQDKLCIPAVVRCLADPLNCSQNSTWDLHAWPAVGLCQPLGAQILHML